MFDVGGTQITNNLCLVFIGKGFAGFEFNNENILNNQVGIVVSNFGSVFIEDLKRVLLLNLDPIFSQTMHERIFIHFFKMSCPMVFVDGISGFTNLIA